MATNSCVKYSFSVEWETEIPLGGIPRWSPNVILLKGIECKLQLWTYQESYYLELVLRKREEQEELDKFTVKTFIRIPSYATPKLIAYRQLSKVQWKLTSQISESTLWRAKKNLWKHTVGTILSEIPNLVNTRKVTIVCEFHSPDIHLDKTHVSTQTTLNIVDLQSLSRDISTILKDKTFSDVKLKCAGCTFSVNKSVLAVRSEVFAAMFRNKMEEAKTGVVHIKDMDPELLELLLKYVYSAEIPDLCVQTAHRLYEAADKYAVHGLRRACSNWMVEGQTTDNCLDFLVLADKHSDENFKEAVACFVAEHLPDLSADSWSTFSDNYPQLEFAVLKKRCADSMPGAAKRAKTEFQ